MAKTLADLRAGIRTYLDEAAQADWTDAEVLREANFAYQDLAGHVMEVYEDFYFTTTPFKYSAVVNQQQYVIDPSLIKIRRVEINYNPSNSTTQPIRCIALDIDELPLGLSNQALSGSGIFNAGYYLIGDIGNQQLGLVPVPTVAATNNISVWGIALPVDLAQDTDNVNIPWADRFAKLVDIKAAAELLRKGQQEVKAAEDLVSQYNAGVLDMKTFLKERQADGPWMIEDSALEDIQFDVSL